MPIWCLHRSDSAQLLMNDSIKRGLSLGKAPENMDVHFLLSPKACLPDHQNFYDMWVGD